MNKTHLLKISLCILLEVFYFTFQMCHIYLQLSWTIVQPTSERPNVDVAVSSETAADLYNSTSHHRKEYFSSRNHGKLKFRWIIVILHVQIDRPCSSGVIEMQVSSVKDQLMSWKIVLRLKRVGIAFCRHL